MARRKADPEPEHDGIPSELYPAVRAIFSSADPVRGYRQWREFTEQARAAGYRGLSGLDKAAETDAGYQRWRRRQERKRRLMAEDEQLRNRGTT